MSQAREGPRERAVYQDINIAGSARAQLGDTYIRNAQHVSIVQSRLAHGTAQEAFEQQKTGKARQSIKTGEGIPNTSD